MASVVTLSWAIAPGIYRPGAAEAAWRVAGVTNVHNHLEVVLPPGDVRDDSMLTTAANDALAANVTVPAGVEGNTGHHRRGTNRTPAAITLICEFRADPRQCFRDCRLVP